MGRRCWPQAQALKGKFVLKVFLVQSESHAKKAQKVLCISNTIENHVLVHIWISDRTNLVTNEATEPVLVPFVTVYSSYFDCITKSFTSQQRVGFHEQFIRWKFAEFVCVLTWRKVKVQQFCKNNDLIFNCVFHSNTGRLRKMTPPTPQ